MQNAGDAVLADAVHASVRDLIYKVEVDWDKDGSYDHVLSDLSEVTKNISIMRDFQGTLPPEVTMTEGFMSASCAITLGGTRTQDTMAIAKILSPLRTDSPLYGQPRMTFPVRASIGLRLPSGTEVLMRQFTGKIEDCSVSGKPLEASLSVLDASEDTQADIDLPQFAVPAGSPATQEVGFRLRTNSQWIIDYILRRNGRFMTPGNHFRDFFVATLHGSICPEVGHSPFQWTGEGAVRDDTQIFYSGRTGWGLCYGGGPSFYHVTDCRTEATSFNCGPNAKVCFQMQVNLSRAPFQHPSSLGYQCVFSSGNGWFVGNSIVIKVNTAGRVFADFYNGTSLIQSIGGPTLGTSGMADVWVEVDISGALTGSTVRFPGQTTSVNLTGMSTNPSLSLYPHVFVIAATPMQDLHISNCVGLSAGATRYNPTTWTPQVTLDTGLGEMTGIPLRRGVNAWEALREVVQAEFGVFGHDEFGVPFFQNRNTVRTQNLTIEKMVDQDRVLVDLHVSERAGSLRNKITAQVAERRWGAGPSDSPTQWETVYSLENAKDILLFPGVNTLDLQVDDAWAQIDPYVAPTLYTTAQWGNVSGVDHTHGFAACSTSGVEVTTGLSCTLVPLSPLVGPDMFRAIFTNTNTFFIRLQTTDGGGAWKVRGRKFTSQTPKPYSWSRASSITNYGEKVLDLPVNDFRQTGAGVQPIAVGLLKDLKSPVPVIDRFEIVGDPRMQLSDTLYAEDREGLGGPIYTSVVGMKRELAIGDAKVRLTDSLTVRPFGGPGKWILGHPTQSVLGSTTRL